MSCIFYLFGSLLLQIAVAEPFAPQPTPRWHSSWSMRDATIAMPCNMSGMSNASEFSQYGLVDFDWSNAKQLWANAKPMNCEELLYKQAATIKAASSNRTKVFVYRNLVKALPWFTSVRAKITDPAYAGWFLKFRDGTKGNYSVPACTGTKCSPFYHDQDQTPEHPHGDGSCVDECDCGDGLPCGEYLWDHRNGSSLRAFLVEQFVLGPLGAGSSLVDGVFLDDGWSNRRQPWEKWWPKGGFCDYNEYGGPSEVERHCVQDMGLSKEDVNDIYQGWLLTIQAVHQKLLVAGKFSWQQFETISAPEISGGASSGACARFFDAQCKGSNVAGPLTSAPWMMPFTKQANGGPFPLRQPAADVATFLLARGPFAWIGYGWIGCNQPYERPPWINREYGEPGGYCEKTSEGIYRRLWGGSYVTVNCNDGQVSF